jgi:hypothetical protein
MNPELNTKIQEDGLAAIIIPIMMPIAGRIQAT